MISPVSVPSTVKSNRKQLMKCKNCNSVTECVVYSAETDIKVIGIKVKEVHKREFAVCLGCKTAFYL
ncbi:MAG: hypothetical protein IIW73_06415 [Clostridia bacterium]|nr:hypothetical protein [Clostridia bacterium]